MRNKQVADSQSLVEQYAGNPLALKIAATTIKSIFVGDVGEFLLQDTFVYGNIGDLLAQQFDRLSPIEQTVMYWLAINREWTTIREIREDIYPQVTSSKLIAALEFLKGRSLSIPVSLPSPVVAKMVRSDFGIFNKADS